MATSISLYKDVWSWSETSVFAGTSGLSGIRCEHCITPEHHSWRGHILWRWDVCYLLLEVAGHSRCCPSARLFQLSSRSAWDTPGITQVRQVMEKSKFLVASAPHSGDWLLALPIASSGLRLDDEAIRVGVALRLGLDLGAPHTCHCGALVDAHGQHGLVCKQAPSRIARHQQLNDLVSRALVSAGVCLQRTSQSA